MKKALLLLALAVPFTLAGCGHRTTVVVQEPPPPINYSAIAQRGFHDGFEAARRDVANNHPPNLEAHPRFRNPPVPPPAWEDYRHGFREGYNRALHG
ncbi:MAG TPA: hypothetical protein VGJ21_20505 [Terracidiphilus sp.]|jgi:hypothetical protein